MKKSINFIYILIFLFSLPASAEETLPRNEEAVALEFGRITEPIQKEQMDPEHWEIGNEKAFKVITVDEAEYSTIDAKVIYAGENIIFWADTRIDTPQSTEFENKLSGFDRELIPMFRELFGTETSLRKPNDRYIHAVFTDKIGLRYLGYFSVQDLNDPQIDPESNGMDLFFLHSRLMDHEGKDLWDTLSHEFQHMIHFAYDPNEELFVDEGVSGIAQLIGNGAFPDQMILNWMEDTGRSLIYWDPVAEDNSYYGSAFLFMLYLYDRLGAETLRNVIADPLNGPDGIDHAISDSGVTADEIFLEYAAAVLLNLYLQAPEPEFSWNSLEFKQDDLYREIPNLPGDSYSKRFTVSQYGIDYYRMACSQGKYLVTITGDESTPVTELSIPESENVRWSGAVNNSESRLSMTIELPEREKPLILSYDISYNIEPAYDFLYILLTDEAGNKTVLSSSSASYEAPFGPAYNGESNGTIKENIDLSQWAGEKISVRFVYLTDSAETRDGVLLANFKLNDVPLSEDLIELTGFTPYISPVEQRWGAFCLKKVFTFEGGEYKPITFKQAVGAEPMQFICDANAGNEIGCWWGVSAMTRESRSESGYTITVERIE